MEHKWQFFAIPGDPKEPQPAPNMRAVAICTECGEARQQTIMVSSGVRLDLTGECPGREGRPEPFVGFVNR